MLMNVIEQGLKHTDSGLGDRSKYIGSSDVGQCPKKAYLSKTIGEDHKLKQLLIFERGHIAEGIVRNGLKNHPKKIKFYEQVEAVGQDTSNDFIKTHIDFVVEFPKELVIVECKSYSTPLEDNKPKESWVQQVQLQMGLLRQTAKKKVRGIIAAFNVNTGEHNEFPVTFSQPLFDAAVKRAGTLWDCVVNKDEPKGEPGPLCSVCPFAADCSECGKDGEAMPEEINQMTAQLKRIREAKKDERAIRENLKAFMEAADLDTIKGAAGVAKLQEGKAREKVDTNLLKQRYPEVAKEVITASTPYSKLTVY